MRTSSSGHRRSQDAFYYTLVYPGVGHFILRRFGWGFFYSGVASGCVLLFFFEFWIQIRLFMRAAADALRDTRAPLPDIHYGRLTIWLLGLAAVYAVSLLDIRRRLKAQATPPPLPPAE